MKHCLEFILLWCLTLTNAATSAKRHLRGSSDTIRLLFEQQHLGGGVINPEDCPVVPADIPCDLNKTVSCGGCKYEHECAAESIGFLPRRDCQYSSKFFNDTVNVSLNKLDCPPIAAGTLCLALSAPLSCGGCEYNSDCFARVAGFDPDVECESVATPPPVDEDFINPVFLKNCPVSDPLIDCFEFSDAVVCGTENCDYNSTCAAFAAGWNDTFCEDPPFDQSQCPAVPDPLEGQAVCPDLFDPVSCSFCEYENVCSGITAGYNLTSCVSITSPEEADVLELEPEPEPIAEESDEFDPTTCPDVFQAIAVTCIPIIDPIVCYVGGDTKRGCGYTSQCLAAGAGFNTQLECKFRDPSPELTKCLPASENNCTDLAIGVFCNSTCNYGSFCEAEAAGYLEDECRFELGLPDQAIDEDPIMINPEMCPLTQNIIPCTGKLGEVVCLGCRKSTTVLLLKGRRPPDSTTVLTFFRSLLPTVYDSRCLAAGAGFNDEDCEAITPATIFVEDPAVEAISSSENTDTNSTEDVDTLETVEETEPAGPYICPLSAPSPCISLRVPVACVDSLSVGVECSKFLQKPQTGREVVMSLETCNSTYFPCFQTITIFALQTRLVLRDYDAGRLPMPF